MKTVIIGAGPAGITVAETLRQNNYHEEILLFSSEPYPPYAPPAMIDYFMTDKVSHLWRWKDIPKTLGIDFRPDTKVTGIIPEEHAILLADGHKFNYDQLVIATGSYLKAERCSIFMPLRVKSPNFSTQPMLESMLRCTG